MSDLFTHFGIHIIHNYKGYYLGEESNGYLNKIFNIVIN